MKNFSAAENFDARVAAIKVPTPVDADVYGDASEIARAVDGAARALGWANEEHGSFGRLIPPGAHVLIKPNLVLHENQGPWGMEPLVTHKSLIQASVEAALRTGAAEVMVGDAPLQGCDFEKLLRVTKLDAWAEDLMKREPRFKGIRDFRRTTCEFIDGVRVAADNLQSEDCFVLFDLATESLLEPITDERESFRVTCYDPRLMAQTHRPGRHRYLVAREVIEADVVINLPKLKTHMKAGITCALKNLIGINGNKEFLPHHRIGGAASGGDCYPGRSSVKRTLEFVADRQHSADVSPAMGKLWHNATRGLNRVLHLSGDQLGIEGAWSGNDTIWRTCLDLNRILLYGRADATMGDEPQRRVVHLVDAVIAGQGNGPLTPEPLSLGLILASQNAAAMDWIGALLLGYDPATIPISREAYKRFRWPLAATNIGDVYLLGDLGEGRSDQLLNASQTLVTSYPIGWRDAALAARANDEAAQGII